MPLQSVPDPFDEATHCRLDAALDEDIAEMEDLIRRTKYAALLLSIVSHSDHVLDPTYLGVHEAHVLVNTYGDLQDMLSDAWTRKSYREIRSLAILQGLATTPNYVDPGLPDVHRSLSQSFDAEYQGAAVDAFYEYLTRNMILFKSPPGTPYFAKICPMIQSSGTGKSRLLLELCKKDVIVVYMNLRERDDFTGFPARDTIPSNILTDFPKTPYEYRIACYAFFTALFVTLEEHLSTLLATDNGRADITHWVEQMCSVSYPARFTARDEFFTKVTAKYLKLHAQLSLPVLASPFFVHVCQAYRKLCECLRRIFPKNSGEPSVVIAVDEAQRLAEMHGFGAHKYRPVDFLYELVNEYSHHQDHAVWVVFASTASKIANFTPRKIYSSARMVHIGETLFSPYTQLGWDQNALKLGDVSVEDISKLRHITGYGRPLWNSLMCVPTAQSKVVETASSELCGGDSFDPKETSHVLAVLSQRFGLNVTLGHPDSVARVENGVVDHLRICHGTTLDRRWKFTSYPSEPLLSCVAAHHLHGGPHILETALATLESDIRRDMIDLGQRGELTGRLLWLLAKDLYVRDRLHELSEIVKKTSDGDLRDGELVDCQMIPVVGWLEFVFGEQIWDKTQGSLVREHFQHAFLNFSHWISMRNTIAGSEDDDPVELDEWTLRHWQRTSAVQCCAHEPLVDQIIPIYFKEASATAVPGKQRASQIFIRNEVLKYADSKDDLCKLTRKDSSFVPLALDDDNRGSNPDALPYIAILADLGRPSELEATYTESDVDDRCLRIYVAGIDATTYPFLSNRPDVLTTLANLVRRQQIPETDTPIAKYLAAQVGFGSTGSRQHMCWEHGRVVPNLRREFDG